MALATNSENSKDLMVVADLLKKSAEINQQLLDLSRQKLELEEKNKAKQPVGNTYIDKQQVVNITTADLNRMLKEGE
jgi:hypothetical protein